MQLLILIRGKAKIGLSLRHLRPDFPLMGRILGIILPSAVQMILRATSNMVLLTLVGAFGTYATAAYGLADRFLMLVLVPCFGLGNTSGTLMGQNLGVGLAAVHEGGRLVGHRPDWPIRVKSAIR